jgi:P-type Cu+ transporter
MTEESYGLKDYSDGQPVLSRDPVCGLSVKESCAARKTGYWGQTYYFCSEHCLKMFEESPERYAGQAR